MSDNPIDPTWWLASDGKWYPPQSRVGAPPPPPPPIASSAPADASWWLASDGRWYPPQTGALQNQIAQFSAPPAPRREVRLPKGLTVTVQVLLWVSALMSVILAIGAFVALNRLNTYVDLDAPIGSLRDELAFDEMVKADEDLNTMIGLGFLLSIGVFVMIIIWSFRAHRATRQPGTWPRSWTPGWSIGGWFIPFANIVIPKLVLTETEKIALSNDQRERSEDWPNRPSLSIGWVWWISFVVGTGVFVVGGGMFDDPEGNPSTWQTGYWLVAIGSVALLTSCISGAIYFKKIGASLAPRPSI